MKTIIKKIAMATLIATITTTRLIAFEDSLNVSSSTSIDLVINDINKNTKVTIKDENNNILYEQNIEDSEKFAKSFNFELLADGKYIIEIDDASRTKVYPFYISNDLVSLNNSAADELFKPVVSQKGSMVYVSQFSPNCKPLYIAIYDRNNEVIHEELLTGRMDLGKIFDFSNSFGGQYRIYMKSGDVNYDHLVYLEK
jgi:hypothetical protein